MREICQKALDKWGLEKQELILIEEMSELTKAIIKLRRKNTHEAQTDLIEEIADVEIILAQIKMAYNAENEVENWKKVKISMLKAKIGVSNNAD